jgi:hypothetical protein
MGNVDPDDVSHYGSVDFDFDPLSTTGHDGQNCATGVGYAEMVL